MSDDTILPELPCRAFVEVVTAYLDGALSPEERARFEAHLAICERCGIVVEQVRTTIRLAGRTVTADELPPKLREDLREAFRGWVA